MTERDNTMPSTKGFKDSAFKAIDKAEAVAKNTIDDMEWRAKSRVESIDKMGRAASGKVISLFDRVKDWGNKVAVSEKIEQVETRIQSNPLSSAAIAFGAGILLTRLFSGGRRSE